MDSLTENPLWFGMPFVSYASRTRLNSMQRLIASLMLCIFAWGPLSPLATATAGDTIPACCRRDGKHHCMMMAAMVAGQGGSARVGTRPDPCPYRSLKAIPAAVAHPQARLAASCGAGPVGQISLNYHFGAEASLPLFVSPRGPPRLPTSFSN